MVGRQLRQQIEPKIGELRQHLAFARDAVGHHAIKRGDAVGGDEEQAVPQIKNFPHLAALHFFHTGQIQLQQRFVQHQANYKCKAETAKRKI